MMSVGNVAFGAVCCCGCCVTISFLGVATVRHSDRVIVLK